MKVVPNKCMAYGAQVSRVEDFASQGGEENKYHMMRRQWRSTNTQSTSLPNWSQRFLTNCVLIYPLRANSLLKFPPLRLMFAITVTNSLRMRSEIRSQDK